MSTLKLPQWDQATGEDTSRYSGEQVSLLVSPTQSGQFQPLVILRFQVLLPSEAPDMMEQRQHPCCALSERLTLRIYEQNKAVVFRHYILM